MPCKGNCYFPVRQIYVLKARTVLMAICNNLQSPSFNPDHCGFVNHKVIGQALVYTL